MGSDDGSVQLLAAGSGQTIAAWNGHKGPVGQFAFSPNGQMLASLGADKADKPNGQFPAPPGADRADKSVKLWDVAARRELGSLQRSR